MKTFEEAMAVTSEILAQLRSGEIDLKTAAEANNSIGKWSRLAQLKFAQEVFLANPGRVALGVVDVETIES